MYVPKQTSFLILHLIVWRYGIWKQRLYSSVFFSVIPPFSQQSDNYWASDLSNYNTCSHGIYAISSDSFQNQPASSGKCKYSITSKHDFTTRFFSPLQFNWFLGFWWILSLNEIFIFFNLMYMARLSYTCRLFFSCFRSPQVSRASRYMWRQKCRNTDGQTHTHTPSDLCCLISFLFLPLPLPAITSCPWCVNLWL